MAVILNFVVSWREVWDREIWGAWVGGRSRVAGGECRTASGGRRAFGFPLYQRIAFHADWKTKPGSYIGIFLSPKNFLSVWISWLKV